MTNVKSMKMLKSGVLKTIRTYSRKASVCGFDIDFGLNMSRFIQQFCPKKRKHSNNHLNNHYQCRLCWLYTTALTSTRGRTYTPLLLLASISVTITLRHREISLRILPSSKNATASLTASSMRCSSLMN